MDTNSYFEYGLIIVLGLLFIIGVSSLVLDTILMHEISIKPKVKNSHAKTDNIAFDYLNSEDIIIK